MKTAVGEVEDVINGLLKLQDMILKREPWLLEEAKESIENVAQIEIYHLFGAYRERLKLDKGLKIIKTTEKPKHLISMHLDVFLDLIIGTIDFGEAYVRGLVEFRGESYHVHALRWAEAFKRLRKYLKMVSRGD